MKIELFKKPKNVTIIEGFPGFGLVGTISTEFLIDHLETELIGRIWISEMPAIAAIHKKRLVEPLSINYNKKFNVVIVHGITATQGIEWKIANAVLEIAKELNAKKIISLEGIGSQKMKKTDPKIFFYSKGIKKKDSLSSESLTELNEGIIMGVTGALMIRNDSYPMLCMFAETASQLPDSRAAAKVIKELGNYLGIKIDTNPLLKQAEVFEEKVKQLMSGSKKVADEQKKKQLSYMG